MIARHTVQSTAGIGRPRRWRDAPVGAVPTMLGCGRAPCRDPRHVVSIASSAACRRFSRPRHGRLQRTNRSMNHCDVAKDHRVVAAPAVRGTDARTTRDAIVCRLASASTRAGSRRRCAARRRAHRIEEIARRSDRRVDLYLPHPGLKSSAPARRRVHRPPAWLPSSPDAQGSRRADAEADLLEVRPFNWRSARRTSSRPPPQRSACKRFRDDHRASVNSIRGVVELRMKAIARFDGMSTACRPYEN